MRNSRFSEEQISSILHEQEQGGPMPEVCRAHGISENTFYLYGRLPRCKATLS